MFPHLPLFLISTSVYVTHTRDSVPRYARILVPFVYPALSSGGALVLRDGTAPRSSQDLKFHVKAGQSIFVLTTTMIPNLPAVATVGAQFLAYFCVISSLAAPVTPLPREA